MYYTVTGDLATKSDSEKKTTSFWVFIMVKICVAVLHHDLHLMEIGTSQIQVKRVLPLHQLLSSEFKFRLYSVSTKSTRGFEKLWRANKFS
jgi:hypothetical protein